MAPSATSLPPSFVSKKHKILELLDVPVSEYDDLSPKGSIDEGIRDLIDEINEIEGCVTTSSCAGRISVFVEGKKTREGADDHATEADQLEKDKNDAEMQTRAGAGGKGGGGRWLYVSHEALDRRKHANELAEFFGMHRRSSELQRALVSNELGWERWVHFKFEPMILHIVTASLEQAQIVLSAALQAGFRESGAINLVSTTAEPATPIVAVRCMGLSLESIIGIGDGEGSRPTCTASEEALKCLVDIANERFKENTKRIERFRNLLEKLCAQESSEVRKKGQEGEEWEDSQVRRERKRAEGLQRRQQMKDANTPENSEDHREAPDLHLLDQNI